MQRGFTFPRWYLSSILGGLGGLVLLAGVLPWWIFPEYRRTMVIVGSGLVALALLIRLPKSQAAHIELRPGERFTVENEARKTLAQILGGAAVLLGLWVTWNTLEVGREGQITDRFTKAIAQLGEQGKDKRTVRLGGIYALERIARDSERDHWPAMEVLTAYVRDYARVPSEDEKPVRSSKDGRACRDDLPDPSEFRLDPEIQAVLTVLGRRTRPYNPAEKKHLDLVNADLRTADLREARLQGAYLQEAWLQGAYLRGARLQLACLQDAQLQRAHLRDAQLQGADLQDAQLEGVGLQDARLQGTNLQGVQLQHACLWGTELRGVQNLTVAQLLTVKTLYDAQLDPSLREKIEQEHPPLLDKPCHDQDDLCQCKPQ